MTYNYSSNTGKQLRAILTKQCKIRVLRKETTPLRWDLLQVVT